jgi:two-component system, NtrC family, sensor kinase
MLWVLPNFFFSSGQLLPYGSCFESWKPELASLHVLSGSLIAVAYYSIPITLIYFLGKRNDLPFNWIILLFASFIVADGTTHAIEVWTLWHPTYWLSGWLKAITAFISLYTALALVVLIPKVLALPRTTQLEKANLQLNSNSDRNAIRQMLLIERQRTESVLRESDRRFQAIFNNSFQLTGLLKPDGIVIEANQTMLDFGGIQHDELVGQPLWEAWWWRKDSAEELASTSLKQEQLKEAIATAAKGELVRYEVELKGTRNNVVTIDFSIKPVRDETGNVVLLISEGRDITERKHTETINNALLKCLELNEHRLSQIVSMISESLIVQDQQSDQVLFINPAATALFGRAYEELLGESLGMPVVGDESTEVEIVRPSGELLVAEMRAVNITWENTAAYLISLRDVTERKQAEEALRESEQRLQFAIAANRDGLFDFNLKTNEFYYSPPWRNMIGYPLDRPGPNLEELVALVYPDDASLVRATLANLFSGQLSQWQIEFRMCHRDGSTPWVLSRGQVIRNEWGEVVRMSGTHSDISDRKLAEEALRHSEAREREKAQALELTLEQLKHTQSQLIQAEKMSGLGQMVAGIAHEINNPVSFIYCNIKPATEYAQNLLYLVQLYRQHYQNPAPEIAEQLELIDPDFIAQDFPKLLASMQEGAERISQIVLSLRNFSRLDQAQRKRVDIHEGIDHTLLILQHRLKQQPHRPQIQVIKEYSQLPTVECYPGQLNQVFMNLLSNAIDALEMKNGQWGTDDFPISVHPNGYSASDRVERSLVGIRDMENGEWEQGERIYLHASSPLSCPIPIPTIRIHTEAIEQNWVAIHIADNGSGIKADIQSKIFDPFFTTKPVGSGTGLGLSISYQIVVDRHGGHIRCHSIPGQGTEFAIELPILQKF